MKLGFVALDGTKIKANASKHKAMSYGRMVKKEKELAREVEKLLKQAEALDEQGGQEIRQRQERRRAAGGVAIQREAACKDPRSQAGA